MEGSRGSVRPLKRSHSASFWKEKPRYHYKVELLWHKHPTYRTCSDSTTFTHLSHAQSPLLSFFIRHTISKPLQEVVQPNKFRPQAINGCVADLGCNSDNKRIPRTGNILLDVK